MGRTKLKLANVALMALIVSYFVQYGGQLFALMVVATTVAEAPPRSFALFEGDYGYDSSVFWDTVPNVTAILLLLALAANWRTHRRKLLLLVLAMFVVGALLAMFLLEPEFAAMQAVGFSDTVDPAMQRRAATWLALDWTIWILGVVSGVALLIALARPLTPTPAAH